MHKIINGSAILILFCVGCTTVSSSVTAKAPAKSPDCELKVISLDMSDPTFDEKWKLLGNVTLSSNKTPDPFSPEIIAKMKPKACKLGGDGVVATTGRSVCQLYGVPRQV